MLCYLCNYLLQIRVAALSGRGLRRLNRGSLDENEIEEEQEEERIRKDKQLEVQEREIVNREKERIKIAAEREKKSRDAEKRVGGKVSGAKAASGSKRNTGDENNMVNDPPPPNPPKSRKLAQGWTKHFNSEHGETYYFNAKQNISSWDFPADKTPDLPPPPPGPPPRYSPPSALCFMDYLL